MPLSDIVNVTISAQTQAVTRPGFGVPMILGYHTKFAELIRYYTSLNDMISDGFATSDPEYLAAQAIEAQNPAPPKWAIGRRTHLPVRTIDLFPTAKDTTLYTLVVNGVSYPFTSGVSATVTGIIDGLVTAFSGPHGGVAATNHTGTSLRLTGTAGEWFSYGVSDDSGNANGMGLWSVSDITPDSEAEEDIAAVLAASSGWYAFVSTYQNATDGLLLAAWAESNKRLQLIDLQDTHIKTADTDDLATAVKSAAYQYTGVSYHQKGEEFMSAAWLGAVLPTDPGSETWKFKTLAGITADVLTGNEVGNISGKNANWYQTIAGVNITQNGTTGKPQFIDVVRFIDWLIANIQADVFQILVNNVKVPYTDGGVSLIEGALRGRLQDGIAVGGLRADPAPTVSVPKVADVDFTDRANRVLPNIFFTAQLAGAIHSLVIHGTVSV